MLSQRPAHLALRHKACIGDEAATTGRDIQILSVPAHMPPRGGARAPSTAAGRRLDSMARRAARTSATAASRAPADAIRGGGLRGGENPPCPEPIMRAAPCTPRRCNDRADPAAGPRGVAPAEGAALKLAAGRRKSDGDAGSASREATGAVAVGRSILASTSSRPVRSARPPAPPGLASVATHRLAARARRLMDTGREERDESCRRSCRGRCVGCGRGQGRVHADSVRF